MIADWPSTVLTPAKFKNSWLPPTRSIPAGTKLLNPLTLALVSVGPEMTVRTKPLKADAPKPVANPTSVITICESETSTWKPGYPENEPSGYSTAPDTVVLPPSLRRVDELG